MLILYLVNLDITTCPVSVMLCYLCRGSHQAPDETKKLLVAEQGREPFVETIKNRLLLWFVLNVS